MTNFVTRNYFDDLLAISIRLIATLLLTILTLEYSYSVPPPFYPTPNPIKTSYSSFLSTTHQTACSDFKRDYDSDNVFTSYQLITNPADIYDLVDAANGTTAFFIDQAYGEYFTDDPIEPRNSFALIGITNEGNQVVMRPGDDFGGTIQRFFDIEATSAGSRSIIVNVHFNPNFANNDSPRLDELINSSGSVRNIVIENCTFSSFEHDSDQAHSFIFLNDVRGNVSIINNEFNTHHLNDTAAHIHCRADTIANGACNTEVMFSNNRINGTGITRTAELLDIPRFTITNNTVTIAAESGKRKRQVFFNPKGAFEVAFSGLGSSATVSGMISNNTITGGVTSFRALALGRDPDITMTEASGSIFVYANTFGSLPVLLDRDSLPGITIHETDPLTAMTTTNGMGETSSTTPEPDPTTQTPQPTTKEATTKEATTKEATTGTQPIPPQTGGLGSSTQPGQPQTEGPSITTQQLMTQAMATMSLSATTLPFNTDEPENPATSSGAISGYSIAVALGITFGVYEVATTAACARKFWGTNYEELPLKWKMATFGVCYCVVRGRGASGKQVIFDEEMSVTNNPSNHDEI